MRLVTRSDFDGLACAVLLRQVETIDEIQFVHPKDLQDGKFAVTENDVLTNVPFVPGCGLWFDHHATEVARVVEAGGEFRGDCRLAPSAARVVYDYYGGADRFPAHFDDLMAAVDKADSADFTRDEILYPSGWALLSFVMDARTGLGRFRDYRISNYQLMFDLIEACATQTIGEILRMPDVAERVNRYFAQDILFREMLERHTTTHGCVVVSDLRGVDPIWAGNRFLVYALWPEQNVSIWIVDGRAGINTVFACGHSIVNRTSTAHVGALLRTFAGGGHEVAGTCQVAHEDAEDTLRALIVGLQDEARVLARAA